MNVPADNAKHFPDDAVWQRHCKKVAEYLEAKSKQERQSRPEERLRLSTAITPITGGRHEL